MKGVGTVACGRRNDDLHRGVGTRIGQLPSERAVGSRDGSPRTRGAPEGIRRTFLGTRAEPLAGWPAWRRRTAPGALYGTVMVGVRLAAEDTYHEDYPETIGVGDRCQHRHA